MLTCYSPLLKRVLKLTRDLKPLVWYRFIDDIFVVYEHGVDQLNHMVNLFNSSYGSLQLTLEWSYVEVAFLDTIVFLAHGKLSTKLYRKPTDATNYLMHNSVHPPGCKKGFKSQAMRVRRNCTKVEDYDLSIRPLLTAYGERGYPERELKDTYIHIREINRETLLQKTHQ